MNHRDTKFMSFMLPRVELMPRHGEKRVLRMLFHQGRRLCELLDCDSFYKKHGRTALILFCSVVKNKSLNRSDEILFISGLYKSVNFVELMLFVYLTLYEGVGTMSHQVDLRIVIVEGCQLFGREARG